MSEELIDIISKIKGRIQSYLIPDEYLDNWDDNESIPFDKDKWGILFKGDWNRDPNIKTNGHLNLKTYLDEDIKTISKKELVEKISKELNKKYNRDSTKKYPYNVNPNLLFLLFEELGEISPLKIKGHVKEGKVTNLYFTSFKIRDELENILNFHFKLWSMFLDYEDLFNEKFICNFLVGGTSIQEEFQVDRTKKNVSGFCYVDLCYKVGDFKIGVEVNEGQHVAKNDANRLNNIEYHNNCKIIDVTLVDPKVDSIEIINEKPVKNFISEFCRCYYTTCKSLDDKKDMRKEQTKSIILYFTIINNMDYDLTHQIINVQENNIEMTIYDIFNTQSLGKITMSLEDLIEEYHLLQSVGDFKNSSRILSKNTLLKKYKTIKLSDGGFIKLISSISTKHWNRKKIFLDYQIKLSRDYIDLIKDFLEIKNTKHDVISKNTDRLKTLSNYFESVGKSIGPLEYFDIYEKKIKIEKDDFNKEDYHSMMPFLKKEEDQITDFYWLDKTFNIKELSCYEYYKMKLKRSGTTFINGYRVMTIEEWNDFKWISQTQVKRK